MSLILDLIATTLEKFTQNLIYSFLMPEGMGSKKMRLGRRSRLLSLGTFAAP
jgi:hypothetical protein